jgi:hypothetical protein
MGFSKHLQMNFMGFHKDFTLTLIFAKHLRDFFLEFRFDFCNFFRVPCIIFCQSNLMLACYFLMPAFLNLRLTLILNAACGKIGAMLFLQVLFLRRQISLVLFLQSLFLRG